MAEWLTVDRCATVPREPATSRASAAGGSGWVNSGSPASGDSQSLGAFRRHDGLLRAARCGAG